MPYFTIKQGNRLPNITAVLLNESNNRAIDLTGLAVTLRMRLRGAEDVTEYTATVTDAEAGEVEYAWEAGTTDVAGSYYAEWRIDHGAGIYQSIPAAGDFLIDITPEIGTLEENELLISIEELKEIYLFGVNLTDDTGQPYPDRMYEHYIKAAIAWMEKELDITLDAQDIPDEVHDHYAIDYGRWGFFRLDKYPILSIDQVAFQYPSMTEQVVISDDWIVLEDDGMTGHVQIVPGQGNIADVLLIPGQLMPLWSGATGRVPGIWHFAYRAGFEIGTLPEDIKQIVCMQAAIRVLDIAGDLIAGAGIANFSISVPGLSQSVGTTSSATNAGYGARIIQYQKQIKEAMPSLKRFYGKGSRLVVV